MCYTSLTVIGALFYCLAFLAIVSIDSGFCTAILLKKGEKRKKFLKVSLIVGGSWIIFGGLVFSGISLTGISLGNEFYFVIFAFLIAIIFRVLIFFKYFKVKYIKSILLSLVLLILGIILFSTFKGKIDYNFNRFCYNDVILPFDPPL